MESLLKQIEKGYVKIGSKEEWEAFLKVSLSKVKTLCSIYIDNSQNEFSVDYDYIHKISLQTEFNGWCELEIRDPEGLENFDFLQNISVCQLYMESKKLNFDGLPSLKEVNVLFVNSGQRLNDLSPIASHKELCTFDIVCNGLGSLKPLDRLTNLSSLGLHGQLTDCSEILSFDRFRRCPTTDLFLDGNQLKDISVLSNIYAPIMDLSCNHISDISSLKSILSHNLKGTYGFEISLHNNQISQADQESARNMINNLSESKGAFPKLKVTF